MRPVDCYFESVFGMPIDGLGGVVRTPLRYAAQPPFLLPCPAVELRREGVVYRSLSPSLPHGAESIPLKELGAHLQRITVLTLPDGWTPGRQCEAVPLDESREISGFTRLPAGGRGFGVLEGKRFVGWASASPVGAVWNVTIETQPVYRRRGIAIDCLTALSADLRRTGMEPLFLCERDNAASRSSAKAAGFEEYGEWIRVMGV